MIVPKRIQIRRKKGWKIPDNTIDVCHHSRWRNPFITGKHGTKSDCVDMYDWMTVGVFYPKLDNLKEQKAAYKYIQKNIERIRGKNLACTCRLGTSCHADILLMLVNTTGG